MTETERSEGEARGWGMENIVGKGAASAPGLSSVLGAMIGLHLLVEVVVVCPSPNWSIFAICKTVFFC